MSHSHFLYASLGSNLEDYKLYFLPLNNPLLVYYSYLIHESTKFLMYNVYLSIFKVLY